ncbi:hypothetical protein E3O59_05745 [Cryobacterium sp. MDB2-33-2]|nr:hypothetical protein E3O59_05745 [Cryobacterium sp. MDB2-33-2]
MMDAPDAVPTSHVDDAEIERRLSFADAALGAEGLEVTDPVLRDLNRQVAAETLTAEAAIAAALAHINAGNVVRESSSYDAPYVDSGYGFGAPPPRGEAV